MNAMLSAPNRQTPPKREIGERLIAIELTLDTVVHAVNTLSDKIDNLIPSIVTPTRLRAEMADHAVACADRRSRSSYPRTKTGQVDIIALLRVIAPLLAGLLGGGAGGFFLGGN